MIKQEDLKLLDIEYGGKKFGDMDARIFIGTIMKICDGQPVSGVLYEITGGLNRFVGAGMPDSYKIEILQKCIRIGVIKDNRNGDKSGDKIG